MTEQIEIMQKLSLYGKSAQAHPATSLRQTDANGMCGIEFTPADEIVRSTVKKNRTEVKPMMQFKRGMMIVARPARTSQLLQKQTTQQHVALPGTTSGPVRGMQETQRRYKRGMMIITPLENE